MELPPAQAAGPGELSDGPELSQGTEALRLLTEENIRLQQQVRVLQCTPTITVGELNRKKLLRLQELSREMKTQRQSLADAEGFVRWMSANLAGYSRYIEAGSVLAGLAKALPIPYAGQASVLTKFVSQGVLSLNSASVAVSRYLASSQQFSVRVDAVDPAATGAAREIAELARFADGPLLGEMTDAQQQLAMTAEISSSTLSFLESLQHYAGSGEEYWSKTKALIGRGDARKDRGFLTESIEGVKGRAAAFDGRLKQFGDSCRRAVPAVKSLSVYDELIRELEAKAAPVPVSAPPVAIP